MGWAISGSWVGAAIGAVVLGGFADRAGRKPVLISAVLVFGLFTRLTPFADNLPMTAKITVPHKDLLLSGKIVRGIMGGGGGTPDFTSR